MKLKDFSIAEFVALLDRSKGNVYLIMKDGIAFSLKSKIAQLYAIKMLLEDSSEGKLSPELRVEDPNDYRMFERYLASRC